MKKYLQITDTYTKCYKYNEKIHIIDTYKNKNTTYNAKVFT